MNVKPTLGILSVLLFWIAWLVGAPMGLANDPAGSNGCVDDTWAATNTVGAPGARSYHTAVWTGTEMLAWGGWIISTPFNTGGRYNPATDTWVAINTAG